MTIGTLDLAERIAAYHVGQLDWLPDGCEQIGVGTTRTAYLDHDTATVYKVGDNSANRQEVTTLAELRGRGLTHAPAADLHTVTVADPYDGSEHTATVVAMPYLPDDGSVTGPYPVLEGAADLNPHGNVVANGGQLWLIDAGGM